jgi:hypothetical protein
MMLVAVLAINNLTVWLNFFPTYNLVSTLRTLLTHPLASLRTAQINQQSKKFISDVLVDELLQKEGGHALWQTVKYALQPGIIRCAVLLMLL